MLRIGPLFLSALVALAVPLAAGADDQCSPAGTTWTIISRTPRPVTAADCSDASYYPNLSGCTVCGGPDVCQVWQFEFSSPSRTQNHSGVLVRGGIGDIISTNPSATLSAACVDVSSFDLGSHVCHQTLIRWNDVSSTVTGKVVTLERGNEETTAGVKDKKDTLTCAVDGPGVEGDPFEATADHQNGMAGECPYEAVVRGNKIVSIILAAGAPANCTVVPADIGDFTVDVDGVQNPLSFVGPTTTKNPFTTGTGTCYWFGPTATGQMIGIGNPTCP